MYTQCMYIYIYVCVDYLSLSCYLYDMINDDVSKLLILSDVCVYTMYVCMYVCTYVRTYVCMYLCMYIYIYINTIIYHNYWYLYCCY